MGVQRSIHAMIAQSPRYDAQEIFGSSSGVSPYSLKPQASHPALPGRAVIASPQFGQSSMRTGSHFMLLPPVEGDIQHHGGFVKQALLAAVACLVGGTAMAQGAPPDVVLLPRAVAQAAMQWVMAPDPTNAVRIYAALQACMQNNPHDGVTTRMGPDQCPEVTEALAARNKEIADLKKQLSDKAPKEAPKP